VFDNRHNTVLQSLQFLCPYLGFEFLGQGASTLPKLAGIFLSHSQPVVGRKEGRGLCLTQATKLLNVRSRPSFACRTPPFTVHRNLVRGMMSAIRRLD
jgi:hypothetical protein